MPCRPALGVFVLLSVCAGPQGSEQFLALRDGEPDFDELLGDGAAGDVPFTSLAEANKWSSKSGTDEIVFHPGVSRSFKLVGKANGVMQNFVDGEAFRGFDGEDVVRLAALRDRTRFCCMTESIGPAFNQPHVQGILGLAFSNFTSSPAFMKTLAQHSRPSWHVSNGNAQLPSLDFAILSCKSRGEVHFGAVDPATRATPPVYTPLHINSGPRSAPGYMVTIVAIRVVRFKKGFGKMPLRSLSATPMTATLDTGSSCSVLPSALSRKLGNLQPSDQIELVFAPHSSVNLSVAEFGCHIASPSSSSSLLGAPLFQALVIEFRISRRNPTDNSQAPTVGFARINPDYRFETSTDNGPMPAASPTPVNGNLLVQPSSPSSNPDKSFVPIKLGFDVVAQNEYSMFFSTRIGIGEPQQYLHTIIDTGSAMLAVRCDHAQLKQIDVHISHQKSFRK